MSKKVKKVIIISIISVLVIGLILLVSFYMGNVGFRYWINKNILKKELVGNELPYIDLEDKDKSSVFAYGKHIAILNNNVLTIYNDSGKKTSTLDVAVSEPLSKNKGEYLVLADNKNGNIYLIHGDTLQWNQTINGIVEQITINKQGMVAAVVTGTTYKSVIELFEPNGEESFKTYLSTTYSTDVTISADGNLLSFTDIDTSGTAIISKVKTISVEKAKSTPEEAVIHTYSFDSGKMLVNIKYSGNSLACLMDDGAYLLKDGNTTKIFELTDSISFAEIDFDDYVCNIDENTKEGKYVLNIYNLNSSNQGTYLIDETIKKINGNGHICAINLGNQVEFVNMSGWLVKRFTPKQNIKEILLGDQICAIVYKDRIEILKI